MNVLTGWLLPQGSFFGLSQCKHFISDFVEESYNIVLTFVESQTAKFLLWCCKRMSIVKSEGVEEFM